MTKFLAVFLVLNVAKRKCEKGFVLLLREVLILLSLPIRRQVVVGVNSWIE